MLTESYHLLIILCVTLLSSNTQSHVLDEIPLVDGHNDLPYNIYNLAQNNLEKCDFEKNLTTDPIWGTKYCSTCYTDFPRLREGKIGAQFWVAYVDCKVQYKDALAKTMEQIDVIKRLVKKYNNHLQFAVSAADITNSFTNKKIASLIGVEGGHSMDSRLGVLRMLYDLGVRYMTLTHACNTPWADNSYVDDSKPVHNLTEYGRLVVREMNRLGMMVDLSHVSHNVMNQAIDVSMAPVIFSHSSAYSVRQHNRNVHDSTLRKVKQNGGIVMVNFASIFVNNDPSQATINDVAKHINHIVDIAGINSVGIGADYDGVSSAPKGLEDVSKYPDLFDLLQTKNPYRWTNDNLKLLASGNFLRVFKAVEAVRDSLIHVEPEQQWIPFEDLNQEAKENEALWKCRTLLNNSSPAVSNERLLYAQPNAVATKTYSKQLLIGILLLCLMNIVAFLTTNF